jgi:hypothetical protein
MSGVNAFCQDLPFHRIPEHPEEYSTNAVVQRYIDGLGFRLYWATDGLRTEDLNFRPARDVRTIRGTLDHIYSLCILIEKTISGVSGPDPEFIQQLEYVELRKAILNSLYRTRQRLEKPLDFEQSDIVFGSGDNEFRLPFWNLLNGPISDAMYHTGQVVAFRRASGNPIAKGVNVLTGEKSE